MKKLFLVLAMLGLVGCTERTELGKCLGADDNDLRDPALIYKIDTTNVIVGLVFIETIIVPAYVVLDELYCPVAKKKVTP